MLNYMLIKHKNIFECFNCFWRVFWFEKCQNFQKTVQHCSGDFPCGLSQLHALVASLHSRFSQLGVKPVACLNCELTQQVFATGTNQRVKVPVTKKIQKIFQKKEKLDFQISCDSVWRLVRKWKLQSRGVLRNFCGFLRDYLAGRHSSHEKHLDKFFDFCLISVWRLVCDSAQSQKSCVLCFKDSF